MAAVTVGSPASGVGGAELAWSATLAATREALAELGATSDTSDLVAVGITNQRETVCLWDRETLGSPRRAIASHTARSEA